MSMAWGQRAAGFQKGPGRLYRPNLVVRGLVRLAQRKAAKIWGLRSPIGKAFALQKAIPSSAYGPRTLPRVSLEPKLNPEHSRVAPKVNRVWSDSIVVRTLALHKADRGLIFGSPDGQCPEQHQE